MKFVDEYRDPTAARALVAQITALAGDDHFKFMEVCGGHTHTIYRHGIEHVLPANVELVHGPGCPVCVIPMGRVDDAIAVAREPGVIFTSFGDMMRVPGSQGNLLTAKAEGADVRFVYSPLDALKIAMENPERAGRLLRGRFRDHRALDRPDLVAGAGQGRHELHRVLQPRHDRPAPPGHPGVTRPAPGRLPRPRPRVHGRRPASLPVRARRVRHCRWSPRDSNRSTSCTPSPCCWPRSVRAAARSRTSTPGWSARRATRAHWPSWPRCSSCDRTSNGGAWASSRRAGSSCGRSSPPSMPSCATQIPGVRVADPKACQCGEVLKGVIKPWECKVFGTACTPETPIGTCMVSSEGACAAYYNFGRMHREAAVTLGRRSQLAGMTALATLGRRAGAAPHPGGRRGAGRRLPALRAPPGHRARPGRPRRQRHGGRVHRGRGRPDVDRRFEARLVADAPRWPGSSASTPCDAAAIAASAGFRIVESQRRRAPCGPSSPPTSPSATTAWPSCSTRRPPLPLPVHQLHQLRPPVHHHAPAALRPAQHDHGATSRCATPARTEYDDPADRRFHAQPVACAALRTPHLVRGPPDRPWSQGTDAALAAAQARARPRCRSWPSRASAATTWPATPPRRGALTRCAGASTARTSRSPSWSRDLDRGPAAGRTSTPARRPCSPARAPHRAAAPARRARRSPRGGPGQPARRACSCPTRRCIICSSAPCPGAPARRPDGPGHDQRQPDRRAHLLTTTTTPGAAWAASPTPGWSTTGPSTCPATTRWCGSTRRRAARSGGPGAMPRSRSACPSTWRRPWPWAASSRTPSAWPRAATPGSASTSATWAASRPWPPSSGRPGSSPTCTSRPAAGRGRRPPRLPDPPLGRGACGPARWRWSSTTTPTSRRVMAEHGVPAGRAGHRLRLRRHRLRHRRRHLGRRGPRRRLRRLRASRPPALRPAARRRRHHPQALPGRAGPPVGGRHRMGAGSRRRSAPPRQTN